MAAGYSTNPLFKKLGIKEGASVRLINPPRNYTALIGEIAGTLSFREKGGAGVKVGEGLDFIHFFTNSAGELERTLPVLKQEIKKDGMIWVSWYKKSCGKPTEVTENMVRDTALASGLVDVKVCAVDEDWSGLKLVFRLKDR
jgi:hypothetical protein